MTMHKSHTFHHRHLAGRLFMLGLVGFLLTGCAPPVYRVHHTQAPLPPVQIYFYPTKGQSHAQQERDRYECYLWSVKQTGFDPAQAQLAPNQNIEVTPASPPGSNAAAGAAIGAIEGSILSGRHNRGQGMVFGAIAGAIVGSAADQAQQDQAAQIQEQYNSKYYAQMERQIHDYRRAMSACLEARGYTVK